MASETERTQVTTRVVTNHNKNHALTMQWWQVLRHFSVTSEVDDVELVCFVPMELVQFLPQGQPFSLSGMPGEQGGPNLFGVTPRQFLLNRYALVLRYWDVIMPFFQRNAESLPVTDQGKDYKPGDVIIWDLDNYQLHIGLVTRKWSKKHERPLIMHNISSVDASADIQSSGKPSMDVIVQSGSAGAAVAGEIATSAFSMKFKGSKP